MKLSISLSTILAVLPALVAAASPLDSRGLNGDVYFPRRHAKHFGRHHQAGMAQHAAGNGMMKSKTSTSTAAGKMMKDKTSTSVAGPGSSTVDTTTAVAASTTAAAASGNGTGRGKKNKNMNQGGNSSAAVSTTDAVVSTTDAAVSTTAAAASTTSAAASGNGTGRGRNRNKTKSGSSSADVSTTAALSETASSTSSAASSTTSDVGGSIADNNGNNGNNNNNNDPNTSLTLLADLVATNLAQDGQATPVDGQVASLTTRNNFINFCAGKTITNGQQITTGSCNPIPMGDIIPKANMPSCKFRNPKNFSKIPANTAFTIELALNNMQAGVFTNAQKTYYMAPQQLNGAKQLIGHTHVVIQPMGQFDSPDILDPATFTFFKGVNTGQVNGAVTADVTAGVPPGNYRLASINTNSNHFPALAAVAQHGWLDDIVYFTAE